MEAASPKRGASATTATTSVPVQGDESSGYDVRIHPLVLMNISDHYARRFVQSEGKVCRVVGALFGQQAGRKVEITNSIEIMSEDRKTDLLVKVPELEKDMELCKS